MDPSGPDGAQYNISADSLSAGTNKNDYPAAYIEDLTDEEKTIYITRIRFLSSNKNLKLDVELSERGFAISDENDRNGLYENSYRVDKEGKLYDKFSKRDLPAAFRNLKDPSSFYPSLSLLCMLVEMVDAAEGIKIDGGFGLHRGANLASTLAGTTGEGDGLSDHAFGRGFDIFSVTDGEKECSFENAGTNADGYRDGLDILFRKIATLPKFLQPDCIVFSNDIGTTKYGSRDSQHIVSQYSGLGPHINIFFDDSGIHDNHVHLSFGWTRAGNPENLRPSSSFYYSVPDATSGSISIGNISEKDKEFYEQRMYNTYLDSKTTLSANGGGQKDLEALLYMMQKSTFFNAFEIATFAGIVQRESGYRPRFI